MVTLNCIVTKGGDAGKTSLGDGSRCLKSDSRIEAIGTVDELNCLFGIIGAQLKANWASKLLPLIQIVQNNLFDLGADLAVPADGVKTDKALRITTNHIDYLEAQIAQFNENLPELKSFILPGGTIEAATIHLARAVTRRTERRVVALAQQQNINPNIIIYLNRLSDLLFILSRVINASSANSNSANVNTTVEYLWKPGG